MQGLIGRDAFIAVTEHESYVEQDQKTLQSVDSKYTIRQKVPILGGFQICVIGHIVTILVQYVISM